MSEFDDGENGLKTIIAKLDILRNFLIVADSGLRQQQTAMLDEAVLVMRDIRTSINLWIKDHNK